MISKVSSNDVVELSLLINAAYRGESSKKGWTTEGNLLEGKRTDEEELLTILSTPNQYLFKFSRDKKIIGSVLLINKGSILYLGMLTVSPELQNSGIGKQLLLAAEEHARLLNLNTIQMTVIGIREELLAWYFRNGYIDTGLRAPFPFSAEDKILTNDSLDFVILEKKIV